MKFPNYKILFVDDDKQQLLRCTTYLTKHAPNLVLYTAPNGKIACKIAETELPDIIIMDWNMPEMDGIGALETLKSNPKTKHIPVVMATSLNHHEDVDYAFEKGASDYLKKPYQDVELLMRIRSVMIYKQQVEELKKEIARLKK